MTQTLTAPLVDKDLTAPIRGIANVAISQYNGDDTRITRNGDTRITRNGDTRIARGGYTTVYPIILTGVLQDKTLTQILEG